MTENVNDFITKNGGKPVRIGRGVYLLRTGATVRDGICCPPPPHPQESGRLRRQYCQIRLQAAETALRDLDLAMRGDIACGVVYLPATFRWDVAALGREPNGRHKFRARLLEIIRVRRKALEKV